MKLRNDCDQIVRRAIAAVQPDAAVRRALEGNPFQGGRVVLVAVGLSCLISLWPVLSFISDGFRIILCAVAASALGAWLMPRPFEEEAADKQEAL